MKRQSVSYPREGCPSPRAITASPKVLHALSRHTAPSEQLFTLRTALTRPKGLAPGSTPAPKLPLGRSFPPSPKPHSLLGSITSLEKSAFPAATRQSCQTELCQASSRFDLYTPSHSVKSPISSGFSSGSFVTNPPYWAENRRTSPAFCARMEVPRRIEPSSIRRFSMTQKSFSAT